MNILITPYVLDEFYSITKCDIREFLIEYSIFNQSDYIEISNFYSGKSKNVNAQSFVNFTNVKKSLKEVLLKFQQFNKELENVKFIELLNTIEECNDVLKTLNNINRWARSTRDFFGYNPNRKIKYVFSQYDSLEKLATVVVQSNNPQNDWWNIAVENNLSEDDYTFEGGKVLNITKNRNSIENFQLYSVVDVIDGKSIYGRDLNQNIHFDENLCDLSYLNEDDTLQQAILILATLRKRDNLDFLEHGLQSSLIVGQSKSLFNFPVVERQMKETFKNDDSLKDFTLTGFRFEEDCVYVDFVVTSRLDEVKEIELEL